MADWRRRLANWIAPPPAPKAVHGRQYTAAKPSRLLASFGTYGNSSADAELATSLVSLRTRSRQLLRDAPYAKRARTVVVNNVVGQGIGIQAKVMNTRGEQHVRVNEQIEKAWCHWTRADSCHTGGVLHFNDLERALMGEVFTAGEAIVRLHPRKFGNSEVPLALEWIEAERLADNSLPVVDTRAAAAKMGVEADPFGRPIAYWIRETHPGDLKLRPDQTARFVRVPASEIIHIRIVDRWPQTRGEPWLHTVIRKLAHMDEYSESEVEAAKLAAAYFATIESPEADPLATDKQDDGSKQLNIEPGVIDRLSPGDQLKFHAPNRPNTNIDPFLRYMLREVAAGAGVSYESVSRDYSQSNYSSSRLALLEDRDLWRVLQAWWIRSFREPLHQLWMQQAVLARVIPGISVETFGLNAEDCCAVRWKLRGWSWVDPTKEVAAYKEAVMAGFMSTSQVVEMTGNGADLDEVVEQLEHDAELFAEHGITVDTDLTNTPPPATGAPGPAPAPAPAADAEDAGDPNTEDAAPPARVLRWRRDHA